MGDSATRLKELLETKAMEPGATIHALEIMPDHVHLLLGAVSEFAAGRFLGRWKGLCAREWKRRTKEEWFWQQGLFRRALREDEDLLRAANYILMNPVRAGLVEAPHEYSLSGSLEWDLG